MILVDTSVWIDHLHVAEPQLAELLVRDEIACHPLVIEELALGRIVTRDLVLASLRLLRQLPILRHDEVLSLVDSRALWGRGLSAVDAHLLGSALLSSGTQIWTRDKRLLTSATALGIAPVAWR